MTSRKALSGTAYIVIAALISFRAEAQVATYSESLPASAPSACNWTYEYARMSQQTVEYFWPILPGNYSDDKRVVCANPADCPTYNAELAAHCAKVAEYGGDCAGILPRTLAELATWPNPIDQNHYESAIAHQTMQKIPHAPGGEAPWDCLSPVYEYPAPNTTRVTCDNSESWPPSVTPEELACMQSYETPDIINRMTGCLARGTKVKLASGEYRVVELIKLGDELWNPILKKGLKVRGAAAGPEKIPALELTAGGRKIVVTQEHAMVVERKGARFMKAHLSAPEKNALNFNTVKASELKVGDKLMLEDGSSAKLESVREVNLPGAKIVYNFALEGDTPESHYFVADGIVTGDLTLQKKLIQPGKDGI